MTWIRVDHEAPSDDKVAQLAEAVGVADAHAFGLAVAVWCAMSIHAPDGNISAITDRSIETWAHWSGKRGRFAPEFRKLYQREDGTLSGWRERQGKLIERMQKDRERHRGRSTETPQEPPRNFLGASAESPSLRNVTVQSTVVVDGAEVDRTLHIGITTAANQGITARFGEQTTPLIWSAPGVLESVEALRAKQIPGDFARDAFYSAAKNCPLPRPPSSLKYFLPQVLGAWEQAQARAQAGSSPTPNVISFDKRASEIADTKAKLRAGLTT